MTCINLIIHADFLSVQMFSGNQPSQPIKYQEMSLDAQLQVTKEMGESRTLNERFL